MGGVTSEREAHWGEVYRRRAVDQVSWYQREPAVSLDLIAASGARPDEPVLDLGGGASVLVDRLIAVGHRDVTVLDLSGQALAAARDRLGPQASGVSWLEADLLAWRPERRYRVWHDRAVFHFLTEVADRDRYRAVLSQGLAPGGHVVIGTFAADGPEYCSGLPTVRYTADGLAAEFPGLRVVRALREEHLTPAGAVQPFTWLLMSAPMS